MIKNWKATACLSTPLAFDPPAFDALLEWELARRMGMKHHNKLTRDIPLFQIKRVPIPLAQRTINEHDVYCCSDPILPPPRAEWSDHQAKRIETHKIALLLDSTQRRSLLIGSGPYKMRYVPVRVRLVDCVIWFFRGDKKEVNKLLKSVIGLGKHRNIGYGLIDRWEYEETPEDYSITVLCRGKPVLMKTIPTGPQLEGLTGYRKSFGGAFPPYWHPETYMEIAVPC